MKNDIKFIIPDKFLVDLKFKEKLQLLKICDIDTLSCIEIDKMFDFNEMSDMELLNYFEKIGRYARKEKADKVGTVDFELTRIKYSYSYSDNELQFNGKLIYKSPAELYEGTGKFSVNFRVTLKIPDKVSNRTVNELTSSVWPLYVTIGDETVDNNYYQITNIIDSISLIDFNDENCNTVLPGNVRIV